MSLTIQACAAFHDFVFFILDKYFSAHFKQTLANYAIEAEKLATKKYWKGMLSEESVLKLGWKLVSSSTKNIC